jgi:hypothetical protein
MSLVSDIKLIRTDITLDLSQKSEKGMLLHPHPALLVVQSRAWDLQTVWDISVFQNIMANRRPMLDRVDTTASETFKWALSTKLFPTPDCSVPMLQDFLRRRWGYNRHTLLGVHTGTSDYSIHAEYRHLKTSRVKIICMCWIRSTHRHGCVRAKLNFWGAKWNNKHMLSSMWLVERRADWGILHKHKEKFHLLLGTEPQGWSVRAHLINKWFCHVWLDTVASQT